MSKRSSLTGALRVVRPSIQINEDNEVENSEEIQDISSPKHRDETDLLSLTSPIFRETKRHRSSLSSSVRVSKGRIDSLGSIGSRNSIIANEKLNDTLEITEDINRSWKIDDFSLGKPLGRGKFGNVYLAKQKQTDTSIALKVLFKQPMISSNCVNMLRREVEIQSHLKHHNIAQLYGYFHDNKNVYLILQYIGGGELFKFMQKHGCFEERICKKYMSDISNAVKFMHEHHVIHRDIKPENILIHDDGRLCLADFGWAVHAIEPYHRRSTQCGTPEYLTPEQVKGLDHDYTVDYWALGILMFELLFGRTPFYEKRKSLENGSSNISSSVDYDPEDEARKKTFDKIIKYNGQLQFPLLSNKLHLSTSAKSTILNFLRPESHERMSATLFLKSEWLILDN